MKALAIVLGVVCAILVYALFKRGSSASAEIQAAGTNQVALSNQVAEVRKSLVQAQLASAQSVSNLQRNLDKRTSDLNVISNRLVQTHLLLQAAQKEGRSLQEQLQDRVVRVALLEADVDRLKESIRRPGEVETVTKERDSLRRELAEVKRERDSLQLRLSALQVEHENLQAQLFDLEFLERQTKDAETAADIRKRMATSRAGATPDPRMKLELQPDGTVRYVEIKK